MDAGLATPRWGIRNTLDTCFDIASITKTFASVAALQPHFVFCERLAVSSASHVEQHRGVDTAHPVAAVQAIRGRL